MAEKRRGLLVPSDTGLEKVNRRFPESHHPQATSALFAIRALAQRINDDANEWLAPLGLTSAKYNYLITLYAADQHTLMLNDIGALIHTSTATVTTMIHALESDGFVVRVRNPQDKRSVLARLTPKGKRRLEKAFPIHHGNIERGMSELSIAERTTLLALLVKVNSGFDAHFSRFRIRTNGARPKKSLAGVE